MTVQIVIFHHVYLPEYSAVILKLCGMNLNLNRKQTMYTDIATNPIALIIFKTSIKLSCECKDSKKVTVYKSCHGWHNAVGMWLPWALNDVQDPTHKKATEAAF